MNGQIIRDNQFKVNVKNNRVNVSVKKRKHLSSYLNELESFVKQKNWSLKKLKIMSSLIYLNIAVLHHYPYSEFLYNFGRYNLFKALKK